MTDNTPKKRRNIAKARLLVEIDAVMKTYGLGNEDSLEDLLGSVEKAIVDEAKLSVS